MMVSSTGPCIIHIPFCMTDMDYCTGGLDRGGLLKVHCLLIACHALP